MRALTSYQQTRLEQTLDNWIRSKCGARIGSFAMSSMWEDQIEGRSGSWETRYPIIQVDADRVDVVVFGRKPTQFLAGVVPMRPDLAVPLTLEYLGQWSRAAIARKLEIASSTVRYRIKAAKLVIWDAMSEMRDSAGIRRALAYSVTS